MMSGRRQGRGRHRTGKRRYAAPRIEVITLQELLGRLGPAVAIYAAPWKREFPFVRSRRRA